MPSSIQSLPPFLISPEPPPLCPKTKEKPSLNIISKIQHIEVYQKSIPYEHVTAKQKCMYVCVLVQVIA